MGRKLTYEYVKEFFKKQGCELLENEYVDSKTKMKYRCNCENVSRITFNRFQQGCRCMECGNKIKSEKQKHTYDYVKQYFEDRGCDLLEQEYINRYTSMRYRCICGNISEIFFDSFQQKQKINCRKCEIKNRSGETHYRWINDRKVVDENEKLRQRCYKMLKKSLKKIGEKKNDKTEYLLGYTVKELQEYVRNHPNWNNVKDKLWHLDHIFPIKAFVDYGIKDVKLINSLDNLQPLLEQDNLTKSYKYDRRKFEEWLAKKEIKIEKYATI